MKIDYTIYGKVGNASFPNGSVGITFPPTPSLTAQELLQLIGNLQAIYHEMWEQPKNTRPCGVCGTLLTPYTPQTLTAHEFQCYKSAPELVPEHFKKEFKATLQWEQRSKRSKAAALKRRKK